MNKITKFLNQKITGNVFDSPSVLEAYSTDRSILKIVPKFVAVPENTDDIQELVKFCDGFAAKWYKLPLTVRGSGLDKSGADLGSGMIISTEKLDKVQEIDEKARLVRVQAGVTIEKLNAVLAAYNLTLPVKVNPKETIGGLIANFPTDPAAKKYGSIYYYIERLEIVLANGELLQTTSFTPRGLNRTKQKDNFAAQIYQGIDELINEQFDTVDDLAHSDRDLAGYRMVTQVYQKSRKSFDLMPLLFASQGTLGIITEVILRCEPLTRTPTRLAVAFNNIRPAIDFLHKALELEPATLDLYDARIFRTAFEHGKDLSILNPRIKKGYYVIVNFDDSIFRTRQKIKKCLRELDAAASSVVETAENTTEFDELGSALLSYLNDDLSGERLSIVDDARLPADQLSSFTSELKKLEETFDTTLAFYGSFATATYSVRPDFQLSGVDGRAQALSFLKAYAQLVADHRGSITGGIAEGRVKAIITTAKMGKKEQALYSKIKEIFDPNGILNPEVKLGADLRTTIRHLRTDVQDGIVE